MTRNKILMSGVAPLALMYATTLGMPVMAADLPIAPVAPPLAAPFNFEGFYIGGHTGYGIAEQRGRSDDNTDYVTFDNAGYLIGLHTGYNWMVSPNFYLGVEGDISINPWNGQWNDESSSVNGHLSGIASLRGRIGYQMDRTLLYATGGVAFASSNASGGDTIAHNRDAEIVVGPVAGVGLEWLITPSVALRGEGLYYWFDQKDSAPGEDGNGGIQDTWVIRAGASWYLNNGVEDPVFTPAMMSEAFTGFYVGMHAGYGQAEYEGAISSVGTNFSFDHGGYLVGGHAGYNWRFGSNTVAGVEGDVSVAPWDASHAWDDPGDSSFVAGHLSGIASLRGRLGYAFDRTLIYATGGIAFAASNASGGETIEHNKKEEIVVGPVAGAGIEWMVSPRVGLRAEGLYYWFDQKQSGNDTTGHGGIQNTWLARAGATYYLDPATDSKLQSFIPDFNGFYFGAHVGYGQANYEGISDPGDPGSEGQLDDFDFGGYLVGAHAGYNWLVTQSMLLGVEGDISVAPWDAALAQDNSYNVGGHLTGIASLRGRLGYAFDRSLIFATGGIAFASSNANGDETIQFNRETEIVVGPVAGVGYEWMATDKVSLRADAQYYWFDQKQGSPDSDGFGGIQGAWTARVGASWHYN